ncbi:peroxiredoxin-like family protein [Streptosporangium sandarakinum]|uniref:peroxiredoxin-like family protein n=1 Tax=Streptosporangium sandarakinum TaxID=1260955 RepID=UPI00371740D8
MSTFIHPRTISSRVLTPVNQPPLAVPDPDRLIHLQFRRFAGCPVCNLHLRSVARRHDEIEAAGIREIVVFHSPADELARHAEGLPFAMVADPDQRLYREFGVEPSIRALFDPRVWPAIVRGVAVSLWRMLRGLDRAPSAVPHGGRFGLPGDFLIAGDGRVLAARLGRHAYDQWSVDELLALAARAPRSTPEAGVTWDASGEDAAQKEMTTLPGTWPPSR